MRKTILTTIVFVLTITMSFAQSKTEDATFGVRGNCGMCKSTIEKAAKSVAGVSEAVWDKESKKMVVSFDASKTKLSIIHRTIAASGYDTNLVKANEKSYNALPGCCQYDREMKISTKKKEGHSGHKH
ncbi:MAG: cation transporter [Flavobacteriaceae bacterium]|nr:cation transporter [Flavobacteriaceae bacterium]